MAPRANHFGQGLEYPKLRSQMAEAGTQTRASRCEQVWLYTNKGQDETKVTHSSSLGPNANALVAAIRFQSRGWGLTEVTINTLMQMLEGLPTIPGHYLFTPPGQHTLPPPLGYIPPPKTLPATPLASI